MKEVKLLIEISHFNVADNGKIESKVFRYRTSILVPNKEIELIEYITRGRQHPFLYAVIEEIIHKNDKENEATIQHSEGKEAEN